MSDTNATTVVERRLERIVVDGTNPTTPFPHFWERAYGSCHASVTVSEAWVDDLKLLKQIVDVEYIRFHGILDDHTGLYVGEDANGGLLLNFTRIDQIYDGLIENGVRPIVELSFMPKQMGDNVHGAIHGFWYHPCVAPPKEPARWYELIFRFTQHLVERYGIDEVSHWLFEVWNEPNIDFLAGEGTRKQEAYFMMYDLASRAVKKVDSRLQVGGPATAQTQWIAEFIQHCHAGHVPLDFISTHVYPCDEPKDVFGADITVSQKDLVPLAVRKVFDQVRASALPNLPIIFSEFNSGFDGKSQTDSPYTGPWLANVIRLSAGLVDLMSWWTFTDDYFEEGGPFQSPFQGGFGLIATGSIPKAPFNAFKLLHRLGYERLPLETENALATRQKNGSIVLALWNYVPAKESGSPITFDLELANVQASLAVVSVVDAEHGNPLKVWEEMGRPPFPTPTQQHQLRLAGQLPPATVMAVVDGKLSITAAPDALVLVEFLG